MLAVFFLVRVRKENPDEREGTGGGEGREAIIKTYSVRKESLVDESGKLKQIDQLVLLNLQQNHGK